VFFEVSGSIPVFSGISIAVRQLNRQRISSKTPAQLYAIVLFKMKRTCNTPQNELLPQTLTESSLEADATKRIFKMSFKSTFSEK
jgi:hypothetical protein